MLLNVSHNKGSNFCDKKENLKDSSDSFFGTNTVSEVINVENKNTQNEKGTKKNTKRESAIDEITVVKVNETFITDNRTARKKKQKTNAQAVTDNVEKTTDQNVSCLQKELQLESGEKTINLTKLKNALLHNEKLNSSRIQILEKGLDFTPIQKKIHEQELRKGLEEFCRSMRIKWHIHNELTSDFSLCSQICMKTT